MKREFSARIYRVSKHDSKCDDFKVALEKIAKKSPEERTAKLGATEYRLEEHDSSDGLLYADITRIQSDNLPALVEPKELKKLELDYPLGYSLAFAFYPKKSCIAIQFDNKIMSSSKICDYFASFGGQYRYDFLPVRTTKGWNLFAKGDARKFRVRMAAPDSFEFVDDDDEISKCMYRLKEAYGAPYVTIEVGMGGRKGFLKNAITSLAAKLRNDKKVTTIKGVVDGNSEELSLDEHVMVYKDEIDLADVTPGTSYKERKALVKNAIQAHKSELDKMYKNKSKS